MSLICFCLYSALDFPPPHACWFYSFVCFWYVNYSHGSKCENVQKGLLRCHSTVPFPLSFWAVPPTFMQATSLIHSRFIFLHKWALPFLLKNIARKSSLWVQRQKQVQERITEVEVIYPRLQYKQGWEPNSTLSFSGSRVPASL